MQNCYNKDFMLFCTVYLFAHVVQKTKLWLQQTTKYVNIISIKKLITQEMKQSVVCKAFEQLQLKL